MSFVWNSLTSGLNPSLDLDFWVIWWWVTGRRGSLRPNALDSIQKQHLGTGKLYQPRIKGLEFILGLGPSLGWGRGVVDNCYWPSLGDWLDLRLWRMSCNQAEVTSTRYWVKWRHFQTYLAYFLILASDLTILEYMSLVDLDASSPSVRLITISIFRKIISIFFNILT